MEQKIKPSYSIDYGDFILEGQRLKKKLYHSSGIYVYSKNGHAIYVGASTYIGRRALRIFEDHLLKTIAGMKIMNLLVIDIYFFPRKKLQEKEAEFTELFNPTVYRNTIKKSRPYNHKPKDRK